MKFLQCPVVKHRLPLVKLCVDELCPNKSIVCDECITESHKDHKTVYLVDFLETQEANAFNTQMTERFISQIGSIKNLKANSLALIQRIRKEIEIAFESLQHTVSEFY